jgi:hypothetical protein
MLYFGKSEKGFYRGAKLWRWTNSWRRAAILPCDEWGLLCRFGRVPADLTLVTLDELDLVSIYRILDLEEKPLPDDESTMVVIRKIRHQSPGWRYLDIGEKIMLGDEKKQDLSSMWYSVPRGSVDLEVTQHCLLRRRIIPNSIGRKNVRSRYDW